MKKDEGLFCISKKHKMKKFLEVCLLLLLFDTTDYGYGLIEKLADYGFAEEELNVSTLYRNLRKMEEKNLVLSRWEKGVGGPKKRVYEITSEGKEYLDQWIQILEMRKKRIQKVISAYEEKK